MIYLTNDTMSQENISFVYVFSISLTRDELNKIHLKLQAQKAEPSFKLKREEEHLLDAIEEIKTKYSNMMLHGTQISFIRLLYIGSTSRNPMIRLSQTGSAYKAGKVYYAMNVLHYLKANYSNLKIELYEVEEYNNITKAKLEKREREKIMNKDWTFEEKARITRDERGYILSNHSYDLTLNMVLNLNLPGNSDSE